MKPEFVEAWTNLGMALKDLGRLDEAIAAYRRALALRPDSAEVHYSLALALLLHGEFAEGWREHEWRWQFKDFPAHRWSSSKPQWDGSPLEGRTILLYCEQGFGDILQFIRYAPLVAERGGRVIVMCPHDLRGCFDGLPGVSQFVLFDEPLPAFDVQCPLMSLPLAFGTTMQTIPASTPYLHAEPERWPNAGANELPASPPGLKSAWSGPDARRTRTTTIARCRFPHWRRWPRSRA